MNPPSRPCLAIPAFLLACAPLFAQTAPAADRPGVNVPTKVSTPKDLDRLEALKLYGQGLLHEKDHRLLEALKSFEQALRLDPDAAPLHRATIPLYLALDRTDEALAAFKRVGELDPADVETQYLYARQLRAQNKTKEALAVLQKTAANAALKERPDLRAQVFFDAAAIHEEAGQWLDAEKALREVAAVLENPAALTADGSLTRDEVNARAGETWERIGRLCLKADQPDRAASAFEAAQQKDPASARRLAFNLAELNEKRGKFRDALNQVDDYLRMQPQGVEGYELKVRLLRKLDLGVDVPGQLEAAAKADPHNAALKLLLAREYRAAQPVKAEAIYRALIKDSPSPEAFKGLLAVYKDGGEVGAGRLLLFFNEAVRAADKVNGPGDANQAAVARGLLTAAREDPVLVKRLLSAARDSLQGQSKLAPATRGLLALLAARTRQLDFAEKLYRSCLTDGTLSKEAESEVYSGLLTVLWQAHKYKELLDVCDLGLEKAEATSRVLFHIERAQALMALGKTDEAVAAAEAAVKDSREKDRVLTRRVHAEMLSQAGKYEAALAECQALLKEYNLPKEDGLPGTGLPAANGEGRTSPGDVRFIRLTLSGVYLAAHKYDESEKELQLILEADPNDATANNDLGYQWAERDKNLDEAEKLIRKALELDRQERTGTGVLGPDADRDNAAYLDSLGWVLFRRGRLAEARTQLELAASLPDGADDPTVWDHLGDVYFRQEEKGKALAAWQKALTLFDAGRRRIDDRKQDVGKKIKRLEP